MFMQVIRGHVRDGDELRRRADQWRQELRPGAPGFLGSTSGVSPEGIGVVVAQFDSEQSARANSRRPEQSAWWEQTAPIFDGEVTFIDCPDCDVVLDGASDDARFVQLIECRARDRDTMREAGRGMEPTLRERRPDILGGVVGWRDDHEFVQVMYFTDEARAHAGEAATQGDTRLGEWDQMLEAPPQFLDLRDPTYA